MIAKFKKTITKLATELAYSQAEINAAFEFSDRKNRRAHPPGTRDNAGRFYSDERSSAVDSCRPPSRAFPFSEMKAARTASHCAEMNDVDCVTHVRRIARALENLAAGFSGESVRKLLVTGIKKRKEQLQRGKPKAA